MGRGQGAAMDATAEKDKLRKHFRALRAALPEAERRAIDGAIAASVQRLPQFAAADGVFTYLSFGAEVDTRRLIEAALEAGKTVALPRVVSGTRSMDWYAIDSLDGLERSPFGMEEPPADPARAVRPADFARPVALVPGLAFDGAGFRLGYGGGFYDSFLPDFPGTAVGLCRVAQLVDRLPHDAHDVPVGRIVTELEAVDCSER